MTTPFAVATLPEFPGVQIVKMEPNKGPMVVLDLQLIQRIEATIASLPRDAMGMVLASGSERVFVAGADLKSIQDLDDDQLHRYLQYGARVFGMISQLPYPTAAAINGAALGGGLEIAMHCDGLVAAPSASGKPYPVGLPEAGLSICPGWGGTNLLPARMDAADAIRRTATGAPMNFDEAAKAGMFDRVAQTSADLLATAAGWVLEARKRGVGGSASRDGMPLRCITRLDYRAKALTGLDAVRGELPATEAARAVALAVDAGVSSGWQAALEVERRELVRLRHTPAGKQAIAQFFAKSAEKK